ncbi:hypothetical protein DAEQUDRAFT_731736 [Daedalea quercina L-15889]|uniref:Uncharacterized protein n=1 Tax=Daedalea quercina L-15889 TaxID=1314783 RepID=A0A165M4A7_9APHY|nr:hypothetical protein DAEQUDRAFT_731736 [Daedalea quercina L-15889]
MSFHTGNAVYFSSSTNDYYAIKESASDSSVVLSLSLSDIMDIPDEDPQPAPTVLDRAPRSDIPRASRINAMSLGFILSERMSNYSSSNALSSTPIPSSLPSASPQEKHAGYYHDLSDESATEVNVRGWAPPDSDHHIFVDALELPAQSLCHIPGRFSSALPKVIMTTVPVSTRLPDDCLSHMESDLETALTKDAPRRGHADLGHSVAPAVSPAGLRALDLLTPSQLPSASSMHAFAALTSVRRTLDRTNASHPAPATASARRLLPVSTPAPAPGSSPCTTSPMASPSTPGPTQPSCGTAEPQRRAPPAPRGGVAPALARSITSIRLARERALQAHAARPWAKSVGGSAQSSCGDAF